MNHQEKIRAEAGESDSVNERSADSMAENIRSLLRGIRNSVRGLIRNVALAAVALSVIDCGTFPPPYEEPDYPRQCVSVIPPPEPDNTPQCDGTMNASPQVKNVAVCFMRWSDSYDLTDEIRAKLNAEFDLATQFFTEVTFGRDLYKFKLIDSGAVWDGPPPSTISGNEVDFAIEACAPQIGDWNQVDTFVVFPGFDDERATGERKIVSTPDGDKEMGVIRLPRYTKKSDKISLALNELRHEIGHSDYLWRHANEYHCFTDENQQVTFSPNYCNTEEYGNRFDVMGRGITLLADSSKIFGHSGGFEKSVSGLVNVANITGNSGTYPLAALEVPCSYLPQLLRIPYRDFPLCLEYRKPIGFDADFSMDNIIDGADGMVHEDGLPSGGCVFLQICTNVEKSTLLLKQRPFSNYYQNRLVGTCVPREGFCDPDLGIDVSYRQSTTNPDAVIVNVSGVDETRIARSPNLKMKYMYAENVSENGESIGAFDIQIFGKRISDGQFELIETRAINGLPLFGKVAINFPPDQLEALKLIYSELRATADSGNVIEEMDETDNESTFAL